MSSSRATADVPHWLLFLTGDSGFAFASDYPDWSLFTLGRHESLFPDWMFANSFVQSWHIQIRSIKER